MGAVGKVYLVARLTGVLVFVVYDKFCVYWFTGISCEYLHITFLDRVELNLCLRRDVDSLLVNLRVVVSLRTRVNSLERVRTYKHFIVVYRSLTDELVVDVDSSVVLRADDVDVATLTEVEIVEEGVTLFHINLYLLSLRAVHQLKVVLAKALL